MSKILREIENDYNLGDGVLDGFSSPREIEAEFGLEDGELDVYFTVPKTLGEVLDVMFKDIEKEDLK